MTGDYRGIQEDTGTTEEYRGIQGLQENTGEYRGLQEDTGTTQ